MKLTTAMFMACLLVAGLVGAADATLTREEALLQQLALVQQQLAQTTAQLASCESNGPSAAKTGQAAQATYKALLESLGKRGLTLDRPDGPPVEKK